MALTALDCNGVAGNIGLLRDRRAPSLLGTTGGRAFATDAGGSVWQNMAATAPTQPFTKAGTVAPIQ